MKIEFSTIIPYTPTWKGNDQLPENERITCKLKVLEMGALLSLVDAFSAAGLEGQVDTEKVKGDKIEKVLGQFGSLIPQHVEDFTGLYNASGEAISVDDVVKYPVFLNLGLELLMKLAEISSPKDDDEGNSKKPSA